MISHPLDAIFKLQHSGSFETSGGERPVRPPGRGLYDPRSGALFAQRRAQARALREPARALREPCESLARALRAQGEPCASVARALRAQGEPCARLARALRAQGEPCARVARALRAQGSPCALKARALRAQGSRAAPSSPRRVPRTTLQLCAARCCLSWRRPPSPPRTKRRCSPALIRPRLKPVSIAYSRRSSRRRNKGRGRRGARASSKG